MARVHIREKALKDGRASLRLDYYINGERRIDTLNIHVVPADKKSREHNKKNAYQEAYLKAEYLRNKMEQRLIMEEHDLPAKVDKKASFIEYYDKLASTRNHVWQQSVRKHLMAFTKGRLNFGNVTEEWLNRFQEYLQERVKDVTVCTYMGVITTCLNSAVRDKLIVVNPAHNVIKVRGQEESPRYLSDDKLERLREVDSELPAWFTDAFWFSCYTGLRLSDVETLTWAEILGNINQEGITVYKIEKRQVKTNSIVRVPIGKKAQEILLRQQFSTAAYSEERVFSLKSRTTMKRYIERWGKLAKVKFTYHSSRHTFGTKLQSAGVDINTTSKLMGHKSLGMTMRYAQVVNRTGEEAMRKLDRYL
ncbi:site-specific integrase [Hymenobacter terrestris]|uniref:Site-specific integrase n=1 Tax=Hymenobacter terrestris TaxID=2748310 RepID=A0ABX2Q3N0_9BACT|nr:site-specific integrase [Hymenobacter terrestris]NVO84887.1 site-specific integrase [Hymenobacter terrestris]